MGERGMRDCCDHHHVELLAARRRRVLVAVFAINAAMFAGEFGAGLLTMRPPAIDIAVGQAGAAVGRSGCDLGCAPSKINIASSWKAHRGVKRRRSLRSADGASNVWIAELALEVRTPAAHSASI